MQNNGFQNISGQYQQMNRFQNIQPPQANNFTNTQFMDQNYGAPMQMQPRVAPFIFGRIVASEEEITIRDVPNDGSAGFYPVSNGSAIYMKQWNNNGTISMIKYIPDPAQFGDQKTQEPNEDFMASIDKRFDKLEAMIRKNSYYKRSGQNPKSQNKEVTSDESDS